MLRAHGVRIIAGLLTLSWCQQDDGEEEAAEFTAQDIDQILEQRTQQRQIGGYVARKCCLMNAL